MIYQTCNCQFCLLHKTDCLRLLRLWPGDWCEIWIDTCATLHFSAQSHTHNLEYSPSLLSCPMLKMCLRCLCFCVKCGFPFYRRQCLFSALDYWWSRSCFDWSLKKKSALVGTCFVYVSHQSRVERSCTVDHSCSWLLKAQSQVYWGLDAQCSICSHGLQCLERALSAVGLLLIVFHCERVSWQIPVRCTQNTMVRVFVYWQLLFSPCSSFILVEPLNQQ